MPRILSCPPFVLFIALMFSKVDNGFAQPKELSVKIMSYNIHHANPPSLPNIINTDTIAGVVNKYRPDFVALQEVDVNTNRSGKSLDEAKAIADKAGMHYRFAKAIDYSGGEYGISILSKYPFDSFVVFKLPSVTSHAEARVLAIGFFHKDKRRFAFACTHLDAEGDNSSRVLQVKAIDSILTLEKLPVLIAGDFNSEPSNPVFQILDRDFVRTCKDSCGYTFSSDHPVKTIDYIAFRKGDPCNTVAHRVLPESFPSDHLPILAEIRISTNAKAGRKFKN